MGLGIRIAGIVVTGTLLVAFGVALLLGNTVRLSNSATATSRGDAYLLAVIDEEREVVDAETGLRGYVITGRPLFLQPTRAAVAAFPGTQAALLQAARRDGEFIPRAEALERTASAYMTGYVPRLMNLRGAGLKAARSFATTLTGKHMVDAVRAQTAALEDLVAAREQTRQQAAKRSAGHATTEAIVVLVLLTVLTLLLGGLLGRLIIERERARTLAEQTNHTLRQSLLPAAIPPIPHCEVAVRFTPAGAGEMVGGDFYDVFAVGDGHWAIVVGDVCGKGPEAARLTAMARWTLRSLAETPVAPDDALRFLNRSMLKLDLDGRFITLAYLLVSPGDGEAETVLACAGHPPGILVPADGAPTALPARGALLGVWPEIALETFRVQLSPGDSIVLYTDGVSDPGPGVQRVPVQALRERPRDAGAEELAGVLHRYALGGAAPQRDDVAIVVLQLRPERAGRRRPDARGDAELPVLAPRGPASR